MINRVSDTIIELAHKVASFPLLKTLLKPFYDHYKQRIERRRNAQYRACALNVLSQFDTCMKEYDIKYTIMFGTLLGAVRNQGFLDHDCDIDTAIWVSDYTQEIKTYLHKYGFKLIHSFTVDDGQLGREETYELNGVSIDVFVIYPPKDEFPYFCLWEPVAECVTLTASMRKYGYVVPKRIEIPMCREITELPICSILFPAPANFEELLKWSYGDSYMIPDKSWRPDADNPYRKRWSEKRAVYRVY